MSVTLVVETTDLAHAAHLLSGQVGDHLCTVVGSALSDAMSCTGMAGDDPAGLAWASAYEQSADVASQAAEDVINGAYTLSGLLSATAQNYARADAASTIDARHAVDGTVSNLPAPTTITLATRFEGVGGGPPNEPFGWSHVEHYRRLLWPNGHQDRLHRAAAAWNRSAKALDEGAENVDLALLGPLIDGLPEWRDIRTACWSLSAQLHKVAHAHRSLAHACEQFAHRLDEARHTVEHQIVVLIEQSAAIEVAGNLLSAFTFGLAEEPTQYIESARIAATIVRIVEIVGELGVAIRELTASLPLVEQIASAVRSTLRELLSVRVVIADIAGVPGLRVLSIARDGRTAGTAAADATGELGAVTRLADDADLPTELRAALDSPGSGTWNDPATLSDHFKDHASDFGVTSEEQYADRAGEFFRRANRDGLPTKIDKLGNIRIYDPQTNTFGSFTRDGTTRTFFKPTSPTYWARQRGVVVR